MEIKKNAQKPSHMCAFTWVHFRHLYGSIFYIYMGASSTFPGPIGAKWFYVHDGDETKPNVCIFYIYMHNLMQNRIRIQSEQKPFFNVNYRQQYGVKFVGCKIGTKLVGKRVADGH